MDFENIDYKLKIADDQLAPTEELEALRTQRDKILTALALAEKYWAAALIVQLFAKYPELESFALHLEGSWESDDEGGSYLRASAYVEDVCSRAENDHEVEVVDEEDDEDVEYAEDNELSSDELETVISSELDDCANELFKALVSTDWPSEADFKFSYAQVAALIEGNTSGAISGKEAYEAFFVKGTSQMPVKLAD